MTPGATKNEKIERQGYQNVSQRAPKVSQKGAKGTKSEPQGDQNASQSRRSKHISKMERKRERGT